MRDWRTRHRAATEQQEKKKQSETTAKWRTWFPCFSLALFLLFVRIVYMLDSFKQKPYACVLHTSTAYLAVFLWFYLREYAHLAINFIILFFYFKLWIVNTVAGAQHWCFSCLFFILANYSSSTLIRYGHVRPDVIHCRYNGMHRAPTQTPRIAAAYCLMNRKRFGHSKKSYLFLFTFFVSSSLRLTFFRQEAHKTWTKNEMGAPKTVEKKVANKFAKVIYSLHRKSFSRSVPNYTSCNTDSQSCPVCYLRQRVLSRSRTSLFDFLISSYPFSFVRLRCAVRRRGRLTTPNLLAKNCFETQKISQGKRYTDEWVGK